jgi:hypothetical protein
MRYLKKIALLSAAERFLLFRAWMALALFRLGLFLVPFPRLKAWSESGSPRASKTPLSAAQIGFAVARASRLVPRSTCLVQALAAQRLLHRANHASSLHVGVKPSGSQLLAHAWVECAGAVVVGGEEAALYTPILRSDHRKNENR